MFDCSGGEFACGEASNVSSGGAQLCCVNGDQCGRDSICHFSKPIANTSGYYLGGCTDPTYTDPVCQHHCCKNNTFLTGAHFADVKVIWNEDRGWLANSFG